MFIDRDIKGDEQVVGSALHSNKPSNDLVLWASQLIKLREKYNFNKNIYSEPRVNSIMQFPKTEFLDLFCFDGCTLTVGRSIGRTSKTTLLLSKLGS